MYVASRKVGQRLRLELPDGSYAVITYCGYRDGRARIGVAAPRCVKIAREEDLPRHPCRKHRHPDEADAARAVARLRDMGWAAETPGRPLGPYRCPECSARDGREVWHVGHPRPEVRVRRAEAG